MNNGTVKLVVRIVCLLLAFMMVMGMVLAMLPPDSYAYGELYDADMTVAIGIAYGAAAPESYTVKAPAGFELGFLLSGQFYGVSESYERELTVVGVPEAQYSVHIPVDERVADFDIQYAELTEIAAGLSADIYPAFVSKGLCARMGAYTDKVSAQSLCDRLAKEYGVYAYVASPTSTSFTVLGTEDKPVFAFDCGSSLYFGIRAIQPSKGSYYISAPDGYTYEGALRFNRYNGDAMTVVSVLPSEDYVAGVLPYEISSGWNVETQKAFAVCVRSYTLTNLHKHDRTYGFDLCNTTDCQVYRGVTRITPTVRQCVEATRSMVLTYNNKPIGAYYSSSTGGCTASAYDVWGGTSFPYLSAAATPWEKYDEHAGGSWTVEVSPTKLYESLKKKGYTGLTGDVASIKINSLAEGSTYVSSITVTDVNGKSITITKCDRIRIALSAFVKSANFVVGKVGETVTVTDYVSDVNAEEEYTVSGLKVRTVYGDKIVSVDDGINTTAGKQSLDGLKVITSDGLVSVDTVQGSVTCLPDITSATVKEQTRSVTLTGTEGNFVFVGRGYGHGVGMSQYGAKDLGDMGYSYDVILSSYFPKTEIKNMTVIN